MTVEEKYKWLLSKLMVVDIDQWENDAYLSMPKKYFLQFSKVPACMDKAVELSMIAERVKKELTGGKL